MSEEDFIELETEIHGELEDWFRARLMDMRNGDFWGEDLVWECDNWAIDLSRMSNELKKLLRPKI